MAYSSYLEGLASKAYSESAATELATVPPYGTDREVCVHFLPLVFVSNLYYPVTDYYVQLSVNSTGWDVLFWYSAMSVPFGHFGHQSV
jgi:hypothetical protein